LSSRGAEEEYDVAIPTTAEFSGYETAVLRNRSRIRVLRMFSAAVIDQILLSLANFVVGFLLIRKASDSDYGLFVLVQSSVQLLITAQGAWLSGPLAIVASKRTPEIRREMVGALEGAQRRFIWRVALVAICIPPIGYTTKIWDGFTATVIAIGVFAGWTALQREYVRRVLLIYSRASTLLAVDAAYVAIFVGGTLLAVLDVRQAVIWAVMAMAVAGWIGAKAAYRELARDPGWASGSASVFLREIRHLAIWATVGALAYWLFGQSYNYVLASRLDLKAVADVNASRLLIMPAMVFSIGMESLLVPKSAGWLASVGIRSLLKRLTIIFTCIAALELGYFLLVWIFRDWLTHDFLHKTIADRDRLLAAWACIALIGLFRIVIQSALVALESLKVMAGITSASAIVSLTLMWFGVHWWGPVGVLIGQIAGDMTVIIGFAFLLRREWLRAQRVVAI
jgi:O-antigen/teichoic acid export membrane protein